MMARPSKFKQALADNICDQLARGRSLREIGQGEGMPSARTVHRWLAINQEFRQQYAHAREEKADYLADEIIEIADTEPDAQVARVRIDARKWVAARLGPKKWGDKVQTEISGPGGGPIETARLTPEDIAREVDEIFAEPVA